MIPASYCTRESALYGLLHERLGQDTNTAQGKADAVFASRPCSKHLLSGAVKRSQHALGLCRFLLLSVALSFYHKG